MNTKTLLIAAATLAVGAISSQAQVYSQNVVGYVNQVVPAGHFQIIGSQFINGSDVNQTNGDIQVTLTNGFISSAASNPVTSTNSQLLYWNGTGYITYYFYNSADATTWINDGNTYPSGWYDKQQNLVAVNLNNSHASFVKNNSSMPMTVTSIGNVFQGTNVVVTINHGYNLINLLPAVSTNAAAPGLAYGLPLTLTSSPNNPTATSNDQLLYWTGTGFITYYFYNTADATAWINDGNTYPDGFYDKQQNLMPNNPSVNQGFFLNHIGSAIPWTNTFSVQ